MDEFEKLLALLTTEAAAKALADVEGYAAALEAAKTKIAGVKSAEDTAAAERLRLERKVVALTKERDTAKSEAATARTAGNAEEAAGKLKALEGERDKLAADLDAARGDLGRERVMAGTRDALDARKVPPGHRAAVLELLSAGKRLAAVERKDDGSFVGLDAAIEQVAKDFPTLFEGSTTAPGPKGDGGGLGVDGQPPKPGGGPSDADAKSKAAQAHVDRMFKAANMSYKPANNSGAPGANTAQS